MASSLIGAKKLGQPEPDSNFVCELNNGCPQHTQLYVPGPLLIVIFAGTGSLSSFEAANLELLRRQLLHPLLLRFNNFINHAVSPMRPRDRAAHCLADFAIFQLFRQVHGES